MSSEKSTGLWIAIVTGMLTVLGAAIGSTIKSVGDIRLERAKLDSQLILNALAPPNVEERRAALQFLVQSTLIKDEDTRRGLRKYFEGESPKAPPQLRPFIESGTSRVLTPQSQEVSKNTDVDLFVCGKDKADKRIEKQILEVHSSLRDTNHFGTSKLKVWDGGLYDEVSLAELSGSTTIIVDQKHAESNEVSRLKDIITSVTGLPPVKEVANRGILTEWRISIVICA